MKNLCLIKVKSGSAYSVLESFSDSLKNALIRQGAKVYVEEKLYYPKNPESFDAILSFFVPRSDLYKEGSTPYIYLTVDTIDYYSNLIMDNNLTLSARDLNSYMMLKEMGAKNPIFLPHAAETNLSFDPLAPRPYDIVFFTSSSHKELLEKQLETFPQEVRQALKASVFLFFTEPNISYHEAFLTIAKNLSIPKALLMQLDLTRLMRCLEMLIRFNERLALLQAFKHQKVHIFGDQGLSEWKEILSFQENLIYHPPVSFQEALDIMRQSKIVLNASATIRGGGHERIFYPYQLGSVPLTAENQYLKESFKDNESILFYTPPATQILEEKVTYFLENEPLRKKMVDRGREVVMKYHTWDHRAQTLLNFDNNEEPSKS